MTHRKKLIEVALPLDAINKASAREKSIRHGHPSTLHLWWARRPLAAARAVIFSQIVDDPESDPAFLNVDGTVDVERAAEARAKLFDLIEDLVKWENTTNESVLNRARMEMARSIAWMLIDTKELKRDQILKLEGPGPNAFALKEKLLPVKVWDIIIRRASAPQVAAFLEIHAPAFHDPFAGGGALPLEAQRLGLRSYASDLNPVPVLINKAMIEIPPRFHGLPPINPDWQRKSEAEKKATVWKGASGLAEDVRYYGQWMLNEAEKRIGHFYPKIRIRAEMIRDRPDLKQYENEDLTVIAWLWARTVKSPNPAFAEVEVPLVSTFLLSTKAGKEAYLEPVIDKNRYGFTVKVGKAKNQEMAKAGTKLGRGANFRCIMSGVPISGDYIKAEGKAGRIGARLMAIVAEGERGRIYLPPTNEQEDTAKSAKPEWKPDFEFFQQALGFRVGNYGMTKWSDLFTLRQLLALTTYSDLVRVSIERIHKDGLSVGLVKDEVPLRDGGWGAKAYSEAVGVYLGICVDKVADRSTTICGWDNGFQKITNTFGMQILSMKWDFAEANSFSGSSGSFDGALNLVAKCINASTPNPVGVVSQEDAARQTVSKGKLISTDPPYYDNIGYADLSDFFYVWLRRTLGDVFPTVFATVGTPKTEELVATPARHGGREEAERFFLDGMTGAMHRLSEQANPEFPVSIYYAFKQSENMSDAGTASTGWETFLDAVIQAGFGILGTWPIRTEYTGNLKAQRNALASSIVLVCRQRPTNAPIASRKQFLAALRTELPCPII